MLGVNSERVPSLTALSCLKRLPNTNCLQFCSWQKPCQLSKNLHNSSSCCCQPPGVRYWDFSFGNKHFKHYLLTIMQYQNNVLSKITVRRHFCSFTNCNQNELGRSCYYQRQQWICEDLIHTYQIGKSETQKEMTWRPLSSLWTSI